MMGCSVAMVKSHFLFRHSTVSFSVNSAFLLSICLLACLLAILPLYRLDYNALAHEGVSHISQLTELLFSYLGSICWLLVFRISDLMLLTYLYLLPRSSSCGLFSVWAGPLAVFDYVGYCQSDIPSTQTSWWESTGLRPHWSNTKALSRIPNSLVLTNAPYAFTRREVWCLFSPISRFLDWKWRLICCLAL